MAKHDMLINDVRGEECRIAIVKNGKLEELYQERASEVSHVGNIYKGRVTNVEAGIQAAFIDFGLERNGFLHISDLHPQYFPGESRETTERVGKKTPRRSRPLMQKCLKRGQEVLVQVLKEGIGTKGPTLTSYLSIPGRFIVMMPQMERLGVSRKNEDDDARREARDMLKELDPPKDFGFIVRTAGIGRTKTELKRDLAYLQRLWKAIDTRMNTLKGPGELYAESDLITRTLRDIYSSDIDRVIVDNPVAARMAADFLAIASPRVGAKSVSLYAEPTPLFDRFDIERQIESIHAREVPLPSGGSLVIDSTEALIAIDVNSGKMRDKGDAEQTAYKTNVEAADEICRQLRLRDLGGLVVSDLIDMRDGKHRRAIEQRFRDNLKDDRARTKTLPISMFGILEMTRQRMRPSLQKAVYSECGHCQGQGVVKSAESVVLAVMRRLSLVAHHNKVSRVELTVSPSIAFELLNKRRTQIVELEKKYNTPVMVKVNPAGPIDLIDLLCFDDRGGKVKVEGKAPRGQPKLQSVDPRSASQFSDIDDDIEDVTPVEEETAEDGAPSGADSADADTTVQDADEASLEDKPRRRRRRRGGRGRNKKRGEAAQAEATGDADSGEIDAGTQAATDGDDAADSEEAAEASDVPAASLEVGGEQQGDGEDGEGEGDKPRRRRRRRGSRGGRNRRKRKGGDGSREGDEQAAAGDAWSQDSGSDGIDSPDADSHRADAPGRGDEVAETQRETKPSSQPTAQGEESSPARVAAATGDVSGDGDSSAAPVKRTKKTSKKKATKKKSTKKKASKKKSTKKKSTRKKTAAKTAGDDAANEGDTPAGSDASTEPASNSRRKVQPTRKKKVSRRASASSDASSADVAPLAGRGYSNSIVSKKTDGEDGDG